MHNVADDLRLMQNFQWHRFCSGVTGDYFPTKPQESKFTGGYWLLRMCRLSAVFSSSSFFFLQASCPDPAALIVHAEKFRLIVCCSPREQLLSQGHIPSIPNSSKPFISPPISCCASICICAGKHKYKGLETDLQSVITGSVSPNLKTICSCNKLFTFKLSQAKKWLNSAGYPPL